jgi:hypothetical protein
MSLSIPDKETPSKPKLGDLFPVYIRGLLDKDKKPYNLSAATKLYITVKDALADLDAAAVLQKDSVSNPTQFVTTYASTGNLDALLLPADTATLVAGTLYYVDVKAIWSATNIVTLVSDTVTWEQQVTRATS